MFYGLNTYFTIKKANSTNINTMPNIRNLYTQVFCRHIARLACILHFIPPRIRTIQNRNRFVVRNRQNHAIIRTGSAAQIQTDIRLDPPGDRCTRIRLRRRAWRFCGCLADLQVLRSHIAGLVAVLHLIPRGIRAV